MKADGTGQPTGFADPADGMEPAWSPDGSKIAYSGRIDSDLHIMNADGTGQSNLTTDGGLVNERNPAWSPKGTRLVFSGQWRPKAPIPDFDLYTIDVDGSNLTNITNTFRMTASDPYFAERTPSLAAGFPPSDTTPPEVSETNPSNNPTGVLATADITATFLEEGSGVEL